MAKIKVPGGWMVGVIPEGFDPQKAAADTAKKKSPEAQKAAKTRGNQ